MRKSNYAFVSALYANRTRGLYTDVYFPIIKYALVKLFTNGHDGNVYYSAENVTDFIEERFGFRIPTIVIARSVVKMGSCKTDGVSLVVYENGNSFQISKALLDENEEDLEEKEHFFSEKLNEIENKYQDFISQQGCFDDGVTFVQFITANTDEILGYFENENKNCVDESYVTLIQFLQYIHDAERELYKVVHQLFWSSIIVAFLKSDKPQVDDSQNGIKAEYYLDTSIVLGLLGLSTSLKESYSKDVKNIILNSGGLLRVHPMTLEEVKGIISKVEQNGPYPLTDIADAYKRRNLIPNHLAKIRLNLVKTLSEMHIEVLPQMSPASIQNATQEYTGKEVTKLLGELRWKNSTMNYVDNFREIHDVYMDSYIKKRRKAKGSASSVYFLTSNVDLINFCKARHEAESYMMSTGQLVLDLWMHNKQSIDVSDCILTETMARCLGLHKSNVKYKIAEVARFYNQTKDDFDPQVYKDFVSHLYRRAKNAIAVAKQISADGTMPQPILKLIKEAVDKDNETYNNSLAQTAKSNRELQMASEQKEEQIRQIKNDVADLRNAVESSNSQISALKQDKDVLSNALQQHKADLKQTSEALEQSRQKQEDANRKIALYQEKEELVQKKMETKDKLMPLQSVRSKAFKNLWPKIFAMLGSILLICGAILTFAFFNNGKEGWCATYAGISIAAGLTLFGWKYTLDNSEEKRAKKAYAKWENRNPRYRQLMEDLDKADESLKTINAELNK